MVVGLTGGIASGKTTVSNLFAQQAVTIVDADVIGRKMLDAGQPGYQRLVDRLGDGILHEDGAIDRQSLRRAVFDQPELKQWLEATLHPLIFQACQRALAEANGDAYAILVVPLMFETNFHELTNRICVIDCDRETQMQRLVERDGIAAELAAKMIDSQMDNNSRLARADDVIRNAGEQSALPEQVLRLHHQYMDMSTTHRKSHD